MANYSKGKIAIPSVTGNIVINITAVQSVVPITNLVDVYGVAEDSRVSSGGSISSATGYCVVGRDNTTNLIPISPGDVFRIKGGQWQNSEDYNTAITRFRALTKTVVDRFTMYAGHSGSGFSCVYDAENNIMTVTVPSTVSEGVYALLTIKGADTETLVITKNEEIV